MRRIVPLVALFCLATTAAISKTLAPLSGSVIDKPPELSVSLPDFLPGYYARPLTGLGAIKLALQEEKNGVNRFVYTSEDQVISVAIEHFPCDPSSCGVVYQNAARFFDKQVTDNRGRFLLATPAQFRAQWQTGLASYQVLVAWLPDGLLFWTYGTRLDRDLDFDAYFSTLTECIDRQRYEKALAAGNIEMGRWHKQVHDYARELLHDEKKEAAIAVLKNLLATAPADYQGHIDFMETTSDAAAARTSASVVAENAESPELIAKASRFLGQAEHDLASIPYLEKGERGLQVIVIPLPPVALEPLIEGAKIYETITKVPTKLRRLRESWNFGDPQRIADQKSIRATIIQHDGPTTDFTGWNLDRYVGALIRTTDRASALSRYSMQDYVERLKARPGQYLADIYLQRLVAIIASYQSDDKRTMYVGATAADIYSGEDNYGFSVSVQQGGIGVSLLSYARMTAAISGESFESRNRLAERIGKELVPATLKALGIPRPTDPSDPYSYADGLDRLNQKTLTLSPPVRSALDQFR